MVNIHAAKTQLSKIIENLSLGDEVTIAKAGKPVARLLPIEKDFGNRVFGALNGQISIADDFDEPVSPLTWQ